MVRALARGVRALRENERLLMITASTVLVMAGQGVVAPVLPLFAESFGVGVATVGLTLTAFALARLVLNVPLGSLADRRGRRVLLVGGPVVTAVGMVGSGLAPGIEALLAWRVVAGAGSAMYMTGAYIYLADISTAANRARFIGTNQGGLLLGVAIGPALGGFLAEGFGLRAPFYVVGGLALAAGLYAHLRLPETRPAQAVDPGAPGDPEAAPAAPAPGNPVAPAGAPPGPGAPPESTASSADGPTRRWPRLRLVVTLDFVAVSVLTMVIFVTRTAGRLTLVPLLAVTQLGFSMGGLGLLFTVMALINLAGIAPASWLADHVGRKRAIVPSGLVTAASLALLATATTQTAFVVAAVVMSIGTSIAGPAPAAYAADIAPERVRGLALGLYRSAGDAGFVLGPPLLGALADATSIGGGLWANAGLVAGSTLLFALVATETVPRRPAVALRAPGPGGP